MPLATPHVANIAAAAGLAARGFDVMVNVTCRDRNAIAQQGYLLGAAALGATGVFCLTGDHPGIGDHPAATPVFELDSASWLRLARRMRDEGVLQNGRAIEAPPRVLLGAAAAPDAPPAASRPEDALRKVEAGAEVLITPAESSIPTPLRDTWPDCATSASRSGAFVVAGVMAVTSPEQFEALRATPDITAPDGALRRPAGAAAGAVRRRGARAGRGHDRAAARHRGSGRRAHLPPSA